MESKGRRLGIESSKCGGGVGASVPSAPAAWVLAMVAVALLVAPGTARATGGESQGEAWTVVAGDFEATGESIIRIYESASGESLGLEAVDGAELVSIGLARRCHALVGFWSGGEAAEVAVFDLSEERLIDAEEASSACVGQAPLEAVAGDWDGDGRESAALFDLVGGSFYEGVAACDPDPISWQPEVEEWTYGPDPQPWVGGPDPQPWTPSVWSLVGDLVSGYDEVLAAVSPGSLGRQCFVPMLGDWNGDGRDSVATFLPQTGILVEPEPSVSPVCSAVTDVAELPLCFAYQEMLKPIIVQDPSTGKVLIYVENWIEHECCMDADGFHCTETVMAQSH